MFDRQPIQSALTTNIPHYQHRLILRFESSSLIFPLKASSFISKEIDLEALAAKMKPEQWRLDLYQELFSFAPYNSDLARAFIAIDHDEIPEADAQGRRRVEGFKVVFEGVVRKEWTNFVGALHGAAAAFLVDTCTSGAMITISTPTFWAPPMLSGVSIDLNVQYYHPVMAGTRLQIRCEILRCTSTLANIRCDGVNADTGQVLFSGTHLKSWKAGKEFTPSPITKTLAKL